MIITNDSQQMKPIMCKATRFHAIVALVDQYSLPRH
jgi:hypothetical protein